MIRDPIHERIKQVNHHVDSFRRIKNMPHPTPFPSPPAPLPPLMDMKLIDWYLLFCVYYYYFKYMTFMFRVK